MARQSNQSSPFEPGRNVARPDVVAFKAPPVLPEPKSIPRAIMVEESIGWTENDVLLMFHEEQVVTNPIDIKRLIQHGAKYAVLSHE